MDSLNIDNHSKTLVFKTFKRSLFRYYPKLVKPFKNILMNSISDSFLFFYMTVFQI